MPCTCIPFGLYGDQSDHGSWQEKCDPEDLVKVDVTFGTEQCKVTIHIATLTIKKFADSIPALAGKIASFILYSSQKGIQNLIRYTVHFLRTAHIGDVCKVLVTKLG